MLAVYLFCRLQVWSRKVVAEVLLKELVEALDPAVVDSHLVICSRNQEIDIVICDQQSAVI